MSFAVSVLRLPGRLLLLTLAVPGLAVPGLAVAAHAAPALQGTDAASLPAISVSAPSTDATERAAIADRTGLAPEERPATLDIVDRHDIDQRGLRNLIEVYRAAPGVTAGNIPGSPASVAIRGFTDVGYLFDGVRAADPSLMSRNLNSWHFQQVEVLKGPASVLHGTGGLGGTVNLVPRQASLHDDVTEAQISYGSHDTVDIGLGGNRRLGKHSALRVDLSHRRSDGYIDDSDSQASGFTSSLLWRASDRLSMTTSLDVHTDRYTSAYHGTPLLPRSVARRPSSALHSRDGLVLDKSIRNRNYNVDNGIMKADSQWLRNRVAYLLHPQWELINELGLYNADRDWLNAEDYTFNNATQLLDRTTSIITHEHRFISERAYARHDGELAGMRHRFSAGVEYQHSRLDSKRRFGTTTAIDPFNPVYGRLPAENAANYPSRDDFDSRVQSRAVFLEDALNITSRLILVAGLRYDYIDLERGIDHLASNTRSRFGRRFEDVSWRAGAVFDLDDRTQLFAQYNRASAPITSMLLSNMARAGFDLSRGSSAEAGVRTALWDDRISLTGSVFRIRQSDILTRDVNDPTLTVQGGTREAKGIDISLHWQATSQWQLAANGMIARAEYRRLRDSNGTDRSGNRPPNVAEVAWQVSSDYRLSALPLTIGAAVQHTGDFYTSDANQYRVESRTLLDAWLGYPLAGGTLTLRGRNLTDEFYADWSGYSPTQVFVGAPRTVELGWSGSF